MCHVSIELRNTSESLGEREMLWEHEPQASVSTAFSSSPKLSRVLFVCPQIWTVAVLTYKQ